MSNNNVKPEKHVLHIMHHQIIFFYLQEINKLYIVTARAIGNFHLLFAICFSQHNLRLIDLGHCLHVSVTKFQDKFASLRQVNSPYSWNKFQICCTDMYLIRFLPNLAVFFVFLWISWLRDCGKYQKPCIFKFAVFVLIVFNIII